MMLKDALDILPSMDFSAILFKGPVVRNTWSSPNDKARLKRKAKEYPYLLFKVSTDATANYLENISLLLCFL
jgi:hypothetical protein